MDFFLYSLLNGCSLGLLLFLLASGLSLVYGLMGLLNFAHASFYMLGAYFAYSISLVVGWTHSLWLAPLLVGVLGSLFEWLFLRPVYNKGHAAEMLLTFGFSYVVLEVVQLVWGKSPLPTSLELFWTETAFSIGVFGVSYFKVLMMSVSFLTALVLILSLRWSRMGLVIEAALTHAPTLSTLGYDLGKLKLIVFTLGCVLAGLAGVLGGQAFVTEPSMAVQMGVMSFVIIVLGGLGSVAGAFWVAMAIGILQTMVLSYSSWASAGTALPYILLALSLLFRAKGLMGIRSASS